jgi:exonuclease III
MNPNNTVKYRTHLTAFMNSLELCDIWRQKNDNKYMFTWYCRKKKIYCRLDYWLTSEHLNNVVTHTDMLPSIRSDHNILELTLDNVM